LKNVSQTLKQQEAEKVGNSESGNLFQPTIIHPLKRFRDATSKILPNENLHHRDIPVCIPHPFALFQCPFTNGKEGRSGKKE
jgi:hypothetical protein